MSENNSFLWIKGEKSEVARAAGIELRELTDFLAGRKQRFSVKRAQRLEAATLSVLGASRRISVSVWLRVDDHPILRKGV